VGKKPNATLGAKATRLKKFRAVQRQLADALLLDYGADRRIFGAQQPTGSAHLDRLGRLPSERLKSTRAVCCTCSSIFVFTTVVKPAAPTFTWYVPGVRSGKL
jgi:hypothetical protein